MAKQAMSAAKKAEFVSQAQGFGIDQATIDKIIAMVEQYGPLVIGWIIRLFMSGAPAPVMGHGEHHAKAHEALQHSLAAAECCCQLCCESDDQPT